MKFKNLGVILTIILASIFMGKISLAAGFDIESATTADPDLTFGEIGIENRKPKKREAQTIQTKKESNFGRRGFGGFNRQIFIFMTDLYIPLFKKRTHKTAGLVPSSLVMFVEASPNFLAQAQKLCRNVKVVKDIALRHLHDVRLTKLLFTREMGETLAKMVADHLHTPVLKEINFTAQGYMKYKANEYIFEGITRMKTLDCAKVLAGDLLYADGVQAKKEGSGH